MKLYVYDHCPFCVKARAIFGLKGLPYDLTILLNDDAATPERMVGRKVAPILERDGQFLRESMDIVAKIDGLNSDSAFTAPQNQAVGVWLSEGTKTLYALAIPRWAKAPLPEFATADARAYFTRNKEATIGPFSDRLAESDALRAEMHRRLDDLEPLVQSPDAVNGGLSLDNIHLFAALRALSTVSGIVYPPAVDRYRKRMAERTGVPLHDDNAS